MNFIQDRELALRFKNNAVPPTERFLYLLIFMVFSTLFSSSFFVSHLYSAELNQWDAFIDIAVLIITIIGTTLCYKTNQSGDDREFIERYISIGFPVAIQALLLIMLIFTMHFGILEFVIGSDISDQSSIYDFLFIILFMLYFYWKLNSSIMVAASSD